MTQVTIEHPGEIRIANVNLQDDAIELAESTMLEINGSTLLSPFHLPTGGSVVFPLDAGTYYLTATVRGKPGGGIKVTFYEDQPDAPEPGVGWGLLDDGTVLHRKTGLIFHRNLASPGAISKGCSNQQSRLSVSGYPECSPETYIQDLNGGLFGTDLVNGNAGFTDWRVPTLKELFSVSTSGTTPPIEGNSEANEGGFLFEGLNYFGGMKQNDPFIFCYNPDVWGGWMDEFGVERCSYDHVVDSLLTSEKSIWNPHTHNLAIDMWPGYSGTDISRANGDVWPVRGGN